MKKLVLFLMLTISLTAYSQEFEKGKELFTTNCAGCHAMDKKVVGPALENTIGDQGRDWTSKWIANSGELIASGDAHANQIYEEYNKMAMPAFGYLKPEELNAILDYMEGFKKDKETKVAAATPAAPVDGTSQQTATVDSSNIPTYVWIFIILTVLILAVSVIVIVRALRLLDSYFSKMSITNTELMKKLNVNSTQIDIEIDTIFEKEVTKRVKEKVKTLKNGIDDNLKDFK